MAQNSQPTTKERGQARADHIADRGEAARKVPKEKRTDRDWGDIEAHVKSFSAVGKGWEEEERNLAERQKAKKRAPIYD